MEGNHQDPSIVARLLQARVARGPIEIPVNGPSMGTTIRSGETVHVEAKKQPRRGEVWALVDDTGRVVVHRIRNISGSVVVARGSANSRDDEPVPVDRLVGRIVRSVPDQGKANNFGEVDRMFASLRFRMRQLLRPLRP